MCIVQCVRGLSQAINLTGTDTKSSFLYLTYVLNYNGSLRVRVIDLLLHFLTQQVKLPFPD